MGIAAAIGVGAAATIGATAVGLSASTKAANASRDAAAASNALQQQIYNSNKDTLSPSITSGNKATSVIDGLLGTGGDSAASESALNTWRNSTGYQFAIKQGQNSVTAALGQKGLTDSGAALKALTQYGQNTENQNLQTYLGNLQTQQVNGTSAAAALAGVGTDYGKTVAATNATAADATAQAAQSSANTITSALNNASSIAGLASSYGAKSSAQALGASPAIVANPAWI
ncbi:UNVERIFIED_ORG: hypothetical protein ABIC34_003868 [Sphingomonas sp. 1057]